MRGKFSRRNVTPQNFTRRPSPINSSHSPTPLRPFIGRYFFARFHSKFFLKSPKKRTPRGYFKKILRFVARLRATFGVFGGISERAFDLGARTAERVRGNRRCPRLINFIWSLPVVVPLLTEPAKHLPAEGARGNKRRPIQSKSGYFCQRRSAKAYAFARQCS